MFTFPQGDLGEKGPEGASGKDGGRVSSAIVIISQRTRISTPTSLE